MSPGASSDGLPDSVIPCWRSDHYSRRIFWGEVANNLRPDQIVDLLRRAVRERVLLPGQLLNQDELAGRFGVSRIPLREALRTLVGEGLVVMRPGSGAVVAQLRAQELEELFEIRLQLEPPLVGSVVGRVSQHDLAELRSLLDAMDAVASSDLGKWGSQHYLFHRRLFELSGRKHAIRLVSQIQNLVEPYSRIHASMVGTADHSLSEHRAVLEALESGDQSAVEAIVRAGILGARKRLQDAVNSQDKDEDPLAALIVDRN